MKQNYPKVILIIVAAIILIGAGIWYYQTQEAAPVSTNTNPPAATSTAVEYQNNQYGFTFSLPVSWVGYSIVTSTWTGTPVNGGTSNGAASNETGPIISIRNPLWTSANPRQDIPIMIFTPSEWSVVSQGTMAVSAAPFPPTELGANSQFVFALPARYNYAYLPGYEEVENIITGNPLHATN